jgi:hypothetical protein
VRRKETRRNPSSGWGSSTRQGLPSQDNDQWGPASEHEAAPHARKSLQTTLNRYFFNHSRGIGDLPCIRFDLLTGASWTLVLRSRRIGEGGQNLKERGQPLTLAKPTNGSRFFPLSLTRQVKLAAWFLFNEYRARQFGNLTHHDASDSLMKDPTKQLTTLCTS